MLGVPALPSFAISQILTLNYILIIHTLKRVFVVCPSPTSFSWVYPPRQILLTFMTPHFPLYQIPLSISGPISLASLSSDILSPARRRIWSCGRASAVSFHAVERRRRSKQQALRGALMFKFYRNKNNKSVPNCVKFADHDTFWDLKCGSLNSKRHLSGHRDVVLMNSCVSVNLKEIAWSDQTSNEM